MTTGQTAQGAVEDGDKRLLQILKTKHFSKKLSELHQDCEASLGASIEKKIEKDAAASPDTEMAKALKALLDAQVLYEDIYTHTHTHIHMCIRIYMCVRECE